MVRILLLSEHLSHGLTGFFFFFFSVDKFRQVAYLSEPKIKDIDTYSKELDDHLQKRESKE